VPCAARRGVFFSGPAYRTINVPTVGLLFLQPENQKRLSFERKGKRSFDGLETVEVKFNEESSPTLVQDSGGRDLPPRGTLVVREDDGAMLEAEIEYRFAPPEGRRCASRSSTGSTRSSGCSSRSR
jgi:hypothetical protein